MTRVDGIPCTSVARTPLDLADVADRGALASACERAEVLRLFDLHAVQRVLARASGRRGADALRAVVEAWRPEASRTRSQLERRLLGLCGTAGIRRPR